VASEELPSTPIAVQNVWSPTAFDVSVAVLFPCPCDPASLPKSSEVVVLTAFLKIALSAMIIQLWSIEGPYCCARHSAGF
jgi:hypothetical protein